MKRKVEKVKTIIEKAKKHGEEVSLTQIKPNLWRFGFCCRCGMCCKSITIRSSVSKQAEEWIKHHGVTVKIMPSRYELADNQCQNLSVQESYGQPCLLTFPLPCERLIEIADGRYSCTIYKERPAICIRYPEEETGYRQCTYVFLDKEEKDGLKGVIDGN